MRLTPLFLVFLAACGPEKTDPERDTDATSDTHDSGHDSGDTSDTSDHGPGRLEVDTQIVTFEVTEPGAIQRRARLLFNSGDSPLGLDWTAPDAPFSIEGSDGVPLPSQLAPREMLRVEITYAPTDEGDHASSLAVQTDDPDRPLMTIELTGQALDPAWDQDIVQLTEHESLSEDLISSSQISGDGLLALWQTPFDEHYLAPTDGSAEPELVHTGSVDQMLLGGEGLLAWVDDYGGLFLDGVEVEHCVSDPHISSRSCLGHFPIALSGDQTWLYFAAQNPWDCVAVDRRPWTWECSFNTEYNEVIWRVPVAGGEPEHVQVLPESSYSVWDLRVDYSGDTVVIETNEGLWAWTSSGGLVHLYDTSADGSTIQGNAHLSGDGRIAVATTMSSDATYTALRVFPTDGTTPHVAFDGGISDMLDPHGVTFDGELVLCALFYPGRKGDAEYLADTQGCYRRRVIQDDWIATVNVEGSRGNIDWFGQKALFESTADLAERKGEGPNQLWVSSLDWAVVFTVNSKGDAPSADTSSCACDTGAVTWMGEPECTLRAALEHIAAASETLGSTPVIIEFHQDESWDSATIEVGRALPQVTTAITIDGTTADSGRVTLDGSLLTGSTPGLVLAHDRVTLAGISVQAFPGSGIVVDVGAGSTVQLVDVEAIDNGGLGVDGSSGNIAATRSLRLQGNQGGGLYVPGCLMAQTDHLLVQENGVLGIQALNTAGDCQILVRNVQAGGNEGPGLSSPVELQFEAGIHYIHDNGGPGIIADGISLGEAFVVGNCGAGIEAREVLLGDRVRVWENGLDESCAAPGIQAGEVLFQQGEGLEVVGNGQAGIALGSAGKSLASRVDTGVLIARNGVQGITSEQDFSLETGTVVDNGGDGLAIDGHLGALSLVVLRNEGRGIQAQAITLQEGQVCDNGDIELDVPEDAQTLGDEVDICED